MLPAYYDEDVAIGGPLTILRFADPEPLDVVYRQQQTTALYLDRDKDVQHYWALMDQVCALAKSPTATIQHLRAVLRDFECPRGAHVFAVLGR